MHSPIFTDSSASKLLLIPSEIKIDWSNLFFLKYKSEFQKKISDFSTTAHSPYSLFLQAVAKEHGISCRKSPQSALSLYKEGALLNDSFCHFRLFCIFSEDYQKFRVSRNIDLALCHLIQSAVFWDPAYKIAEITEFINPRAVLGRFIAKNDEKLVKIRSLIYKFFKTDAMKLSFLTNWVMVQYPFEKELAEFHLNELILLAEGNEYPEVCFFYGNYLKEIGVKDQEDEVLSQAEELLSLAAKANIVKAYFPLGEIYEIRGFFDQSVEILKKGAKLGCVNCLNALTSYFSNGLSTVRDFKKAIKYAFQAFVLGDLTAGHVIKDIGRYMKLVGLENRVEDLEKNIWLVAENLYEIPLHFNRTLHNVGAHAYILSKCYTSGIYCGENLQKALDIINFSLEKKNSQGIEDDKYLIYTKARLLMKLQLDFKDLMSEAFKKYEDFIRKEKNKKFPQHYYRIAKLFEKGWGISANLEKAKLFYKKGSVCVEEKANMCWIQFFYLQKCKTKANQLEKTQ